MNFPVVSQEFPSTIKYIPVHLLCKEERGGGGGGGGGVKLNYHLPAYQHCLLLAKAKFVGSFHFCEKMIILRGKATFPEN